MTTTRPTTTTTSRAVAAMYVGLALTVVAAVVAMIDANTGNTLLQHVRDTGPLAGIGGYPNYGPGQADQDASVILTFLFVIDAAGVVAWLWLAVAARRGKRWVPAVATAVLVVAAAVAAHGAATLLPTVLGIVGLLPCVAGLAAVILLWRGRSTAS